MNSIFYQGLLTDPLIFASEDLPHPHVSVLPPSLFPQKHQHLCQRKSMLQTLHHSWPDSFFRAPSADGDSTCTRTFNKFKSFAGAGVGRRQRNQDFMNTTTPKTQKSTRPCVSLFVSLNPASLNI